MTRPQTPLNRGVCLACQVKPPYDRDDEQDPDVFTSYTDAPTPQHRCSCPVGKYQAPPEELTGRVEDRAVQINLTPYQRDYSVTDTGRRTRRHFLKPQAPLPRDRMVRARVRMNFGGRRQAPNRSSSSASSGSSGASDHILLPVVGDDESHWRHPLSARDDQHDKSPSWWPSSNEFASSSRLEDISDSRPHSVPLSRIPYLDNRQRYQPYSRPAPPLRNTQDRSRLPVNFHDNSISPRTDSSLADDPENYTVTTIHHNSLPSPVRNSNEENHRFDGRRDSFASINRHRVLPPLTFDRENFRLPSSHRPYMYEAPTPDSEDYRGRHKRFSRYQLPTPPESSSLHPSPLAPNFRGFSDDRSWRTGTSHYPARDASSSRERCHRDDRVTSGGLPTPIGDSPLHRVLFDDDYPNDRISISSTADILLRVTGEVAGMRGLVPNNGHTRPEVLRRAYECPNQSLRNSDRVYRPSSNRDCTATSTSLPSPIDDLPVHAALLDLNHTNDRFPTSATSTVLTSNITACDGPHDRTQSEGSTDEESSRPSSPQPIVTPSVSEPLQFQVAGTSYSPPTSDEKEVDELVEDKPVDKGYSRFQFMPSNVSSRTYKAIFYPGDNGPPSSPWNGQTMLVLADPDHSTVYTDIGRARLLEKMRQVDSLVTVASTSGLQFFYDPSMSEMVQNSPYPRSLLLSNDPFLNSPTVEIQDCPFPSNSVLEMHDPTTEFASTSSSLDEVFTTVELDSLAEELDLINLDPENDKPKGV